MKNKYLISIIVILVFAVFILAFLNQKNLSESLRDEDGIVIKLDGKEKGFISLNDIKAIEEEEFIAALRGKESVYVGVPLKEVLKKIIDENILKNKEKVIVRALDGYVVSYSINEILEDEHVYLVYLKDGKVLGEKEEGGMGPLMTVPRKDDFGKRWCKFVVEVEVK